MVYDYWLLSYSTQDNEQKIRSLKRKIREVKKDREEQILVRTSRLFINNTRPRLNWAKHLHETAL